MRWVRRLRRRDDRRHVSEPELRSASDACSTHSCTSSASRTTGPPTFGLGGTNGEQHRCHEFGRDRDLAAHDPSRVAALKPIDV